MVTKQQAAPDPVMAFIIMAQMISRRYLMAYVHLCHLPFSIVKLVPQGKHLT